MTRLAIIGVPSGNVIELRHEAGRFTTRLLVPESEVTVPTSTAREWYATARESSGACVCADWPRQVKRYGA